VSPGQREALVYAAVLAGCLLVLATVYGWLLVTT
jgi:hypothetical protein